MDTRAPTLTMLNLEPGSVVGDRYEICERIGSGGMGLVFRVIDRELNDEVVALKLLHPHLAQDETLFKRFRNEVLVARSLTHPNIVRLHDIGKTHDGFSYISMEFVDGFSLKDRISPQSPAASSSSSSLARLEFEEAVRILHAILTAVAYAHAKGIIHRDLKPANVLISNSGEVKLADFGTARISGMDTSLTQTGQVIGTPDYMSPEQIRGEKLDSSCDIYSLGILAYELIVGQRPFIADSSVAVAFKHLHEPIPNFADATSNVPAWYQEMVKKACAKDKADRFKTAYEFANVISEHLPDGVKSTQMFSATGSHLISGTHKNSLGDLPTRAQDAPPTQFAGALGGGNEAASGQRSERGFEIGSAAGGSTSERWELGNISDVSSGPFNTIPGSAERSSPGKKGSPVFSVFLTVVLVGLVLVGILKRDDVLLKIREFQSPVVSPSVLANNIEQSQAPTEGERAALEKELLGENSQGNDTPPMIEKIPEAKTSVPANVALPTEEKPSPAPPETAVEVKPEAKIEEKPVELASSIQTETLPEINVSELKPEAKGDFNTAPPSAEVNLEKQEKPKSELKVIEKSVVAVAPKAEPIKEAKEVVIPKGNPSLNVFPPKQEPSDIAEPPPELPQPTSAGASGLPFAKGYVAPTDAVSTVPSDTPEVPSGPGSLVSEKPPVEVVKEAYSGMISLASGALNQSTMILDLDIGSDDSISGQARIDGLGEFQVDGKVYPRGIEMTLRNSETSIRLTGSRKANDSMRGRFQAPGLNKRGAWDVRYMR